MTASISFRLLLFLAVLYLAGCEGETVVNRTSSEFQQKNIVLFVADDHGQDTGAYGNPVIETPHLDALAADGVRFTDAFATTASCSASRSVILTGLHNHRTGQYGHMHDYAHFQSYDNLRSLPVLLAEAGYRTAIIGKFHVAPEAVYHFEEVFPANQRNPIQMAENTRSFINESSDAPFFLYFATSDPHRGGVAEGHENDPLPPDGFGNRLEGHEGVEEVTYEPDEVIVPPFLPDTPASRVELAHYYQSVSRIDQGVGRLVSILKEAGVYEETLFIYTSDHGAAFPGGKTTLYDPGLRSPLIVFSPDAEKAGIVNTAMVSWVDLTPTILDFAGVEPPVYEQHIQTDVIRHLVPESHGLHGRSFLLILENEAPEGWDEVFASHTFHEIQMYYPMRMVRDRKYKLIWNIAHGLPYPFATDLWAASTWQDRYRQGMDAMYGVRTVGDYIHRPAFELYDIELDPDESENLAGHPEYSDILESYKEKLKAYQILTSDPWLLKWQYE